MLATDACLCHLPRAKLFSVEPAQASRSSSAVRCDHIHRYRYPHLQHSTFSSTIIMAESTASIRQHSLERTNSQSTYTSFRDKMSRALSPNARAHENDGGPVIGARRPSIGRESLSFSILYHHECRPIRCCESFLDRIPMS